MPGTVADVHAEEASCLMPLGRPFDGFVEQTKRVSPTCLIAFERNRYSVPASFANRPVSLRVYPDRLVIAAEGQIVCEHVRLIDRSHHKPGRTIYDWRHYLAVVQRKPGALRNGAPFLEMPEAFRHLQSHLLKRSGGDREMVEILSLVLHHDEQAVLSAVELALEAGVATKTHILNVLHRLIDGKAPPASPIDAPQALRLTQEPKANVDRYDMLKGRSAMRHDPASAAVVVMLRGLKMFGMAQAAGELIEQGAPAFDTAVPMLAQLGSSRQKWPSGRSGPSPIRSRRPASRPTRIWLALILPPARSMKH